MNNEIFSEKMQISIDKSKKQCYNTGNAVMGRVVCAQNHSEPQAVKVRYGAANEEHPGAADRKNGKEPIE